MPCKKYDVVISGVNRNYKKKYDFDNKDTNQLDLSDRNKVHCGVSKEQCVFLDPVQRMVLEAAYEALIDAGINSTDINGKNIGVYFGSSISENDCYLFETNDNGITTIGHSQSTFSNRIKRIFNLTGPSCSFDTTWTSGIKVLKHVVDEIKIGEIDGAFIGVFHNQNHSNDSTKLFYSKEENEKVTLFYLQPIHLAKRNYATLLHLDTLPNQNENEITKFLENFYKSIKVNPHDVQYLETYNNKLKDFGLKTIENVLCNNRNIPLKIIMNNNFENIDGASCFINILNVITAMENGVIHGNKNKPLNKDKLEIISSNTIWSGGLAAISSVGKMIDYGHILLKSNTKIKSVITHHLPLLNCLSSTTEDGIKSCIDKVKSYPNNLEYSYLIQEVFKHNIPFHSYRGYVLNGIKQITNYKIVSGDKKPIWFIYSGLNSQWPTMGKDLMKIPIIKESLEKSHKILEPKGINLIDIITTTDKNIFNNIINSFVGNAAIQIALTDMLNSLGIVPDGILGHSELGCAYADGCITMEQMLLCTYIRGKVCLEAKLAPGLMAAIGLNHKQLKNIIPKHIEIACHNGPNCSTISGPEHDINAFVSDLKTKGIFAKIINTNNIAYHSSYIKPAVAKLEQSLKEIIPNPIKRSSKWISTTIEESNWSTKLAETSSVEYHINNLISPVLFEESLNHVPNNAILIEIAPHGLLQPILKQFLDKSFNSFSLTKRNENGIDYLLASLAEMYTQGVDIDLSSIYPKISYPVSKSTPSLNSLVVWDHKEKWNIDLKNNITYPTQVFHYTINLQNKEYEYLTKNKINSKIYIPISVYLGFLNDIISNTNSIKSFSFENIVIKKHLEIYDKDVVDVNVQFVSNSGKFIISHGTNTVLSGNIKPIINYDKEILQVPPSKLLVNYAYIQGDDFYKILDHRGYNFKSLHKSVKVIRKMEEGFSAIIKWQNNWKVFIDVMQQLFIFHNGEKEQVILVPTFIRNIKISLEKLPAKNIEEVEVFYYFDTNVLQAPGIQIYGIHTKKLVSEKKLIHVYENKFIKFFNEKVSNIMDGINFCLQIIFDNITNTSDMKILEFNKNIHKSYVNMKEIENYGVKPKITVLDEININDDDYYDLIVSDEDFLSIALDLLNKSKTEFLILLSNKNDLALQKNLVIISRFNAGNTFIYLLRKVLNIVPKVIKIDCLQYSIDYVIDTIKSLQYLNNQQRKFLVFKAFPEEGINALINVTKTSFKDENVRFIFILDKNAPECLPIEIFYQNIFKQELLISILKNGLWGTCLKVSNQVMNNQRSLEDKLLTAIAYSRSKFDFVINCIGISSMNNVYGKEEKIKYFNFYGVNKSGNSIVGLAEVDLDKNNITIDPNFIWNIPQGWSYKEAITLPHAYSMAYFVLFEVSKLVKGNVVFLNGGITPFIQACIATALNYDCTVYLTTENNEQKQNIKKKFKLNDNHILNSNVIDYEMKLLYLTNGKGADVIINCYTNEHIEATKNCLADFGRYIHINNIEVDKQDVIETKTSSKLIYSYNINIENIFGKSIKIKEDIHKKIQKGIETRTLEPLDKIIYEKTIHKNLENCLYTSKNLVVFNIDKNEILQQKISFLNPNNDGVHLIYGNVSEDFIDTIEWITSQGASRIVIATMSQFHNYYVNRRLALMNNSSSALKYLIMQSADNIEKTKDIIEQALQFGELSSLFLIPDKGSNGSDFNFAAANNFDEALKDFGLKIPMVCLLGNNTDKILTSMKKIPVYNIKWSCQYKDVLKVLGNILKEDKSVNVEVKSNQKIVMKNHSDIFSTFPKSIYFLNKIGYDNQNSKNIIKMESNGPKQITWMVPYFIVPGIFHPNSEYIKNIAKCLKTPVYCLNIKDEDLDKNIEEEIAKEILQIHDGQYNLIGISWSGALSINIVKHLEKMKKKTQLILIDALPDLYKNYIDDCGFFIKERYLQKLLNVYDDYGMKYHDIDEKLEMYIRLSEKPNIDSKIVRKALNTIEKYVDYVRNFETYEGINGRMISFITNLDQENNLNNFSKVAKHIEIKSMKMLDNLCENNELWDFINDNQLTIVN